MFEQDYVMRLIHEIVRALLKLLFNINSDKDEEFAFKEKEKEKKYDELLDTIDRGEINEAENKLLDELDPENLQDYKMALMFYMHLNEKEADFLEEHGFSKAEIIYGLKYVSKIYGYEGMMDVLLSTISD